MLVLSRKCDEEVRIGDDIVIRVVQLTGGRVRLGIEAPAEIRVRRGELCEDHVPNNAGTTLVKRPPKSPTSCNFS